MTKSELRPGDILLLKDEPDNTTWTHKAIVAGQALTSVNLARYHRGSADMVHAVIWVQNRGNIAEAEIAEASGTGRVRTSDLRRGYYMVYRPGDENLGDWAAQVALMWAVGGHIAYGKTMSVASIFHSDSFGANARIRAQAYTKDAFTNDPEWGAGGAFCSQFVIASYQAAAGQIGIAYSGFLACDAQHCSVRAMQDHLIRDRANFPQVGDIRVG